MAIARRLKPFGVKRLLYSGRTAKSYAAEVEGEYGERGWRGYGKQESIRERVRIR